MNVPTLEILKDIDQLITEITGFQENDENFGICQRYCLSHVIHHTYPCVNRSSVKTLMESYISRFYGHGYFKVSQELSQQVEKFLSNVNLFEKNPQYDIQWCLLNLVCLLSADLTAVKSVPQLLPTDIQENEIDDINWNEYLVKELKLEFCKLSSDSETESIEDEENNHYVELPISKKEINDDDKIIVQKKNEDTIRSNEFTRKTSSEQRKQTINKIRSSKKSTINLEYDFALRGNISEKFDRLMNAEGIHRKSQYLSEYQMMEYILHQFLTGERIFLKKGLHSPALLSITQDTLSNHIASLQPYFKLTRSFIDFDTEIMEAKFPEKFQHKNYSLKPPQGSLLIYKRQKIPNVLYIYNMVLKKALESFQSDLLNIADNCKCAKQKFKKFEILVILIYCILSQVQYYTLIRMERKLQPHFYNLTSLFRIHCLATLNWKKSSNWMCSVRILSVLYHAIMDATTESESFLLMNLFLHCFKVYLDIIDSWVSSLQLNDPNEEFIILKSGTTKNCVDFGLEFEIRPYLEELDKEGVKKVPILDFIAEKMIHVGESLVILKRLGRYTNYDCTSRTSLFQKIVEDINKEISNLGKPKPVIPNPAVQEKKKSIFTLCNININLRDDDGGGDFFEIEDKKELKDKERESDSSSSNESEQFNEGCVNFINSTIKNPYFKMAFSIMGIKSSMKKLEEGKARNEGNMALNIVQKANHKICAFYPFHKLITESCQRIIDGRVFTACTLVKNIVLTEFHLQNHFSLLKNIFFFNESFLIQPFLINLFTQPLIWDNCYSLTLHLKECLESRYKNLASAFSVFVEKDYKNSSSNIITAINAITINYKVNWPLTLIFTSDAISKYNKVFRFALKLKWAHWLLCSLQFEGAINKRSMFDRSNTFHRLQLLKFRVLSILNRIENYFISHLSSYDLDLNSYNDLRDIITAHSNFIDKIYRNCLLRVPQMGTLILQNLIPLCMSIEKLYLRNCSAVSSELSTMETTFDNCHLQLCNILSSLEME